MSEKRFTLDDEKNGLCRCILVDGEEIPTCEICDLLNRQQATITKLKELNDDKGKRIISLIRTNKTLKEENEQLKQQSSEKQEHITHLESKIHRMREQIHKLEKLYHYRSADIKRENEQLKNRLNKDL